MHIFHVHSNINLIVALAIIDERNLHCDELVILLARGIQLKSGGYRTIVLEDAIYYHPFNTLKRLNTFDFLKNEKMINGIDSIIFQASKGQSFHYYVPNSRNFLYRAFISNNACIQVDYIEDGLDNYLSNQDFEKKYNFKIKSIHKVLDNAMSILPFFRIDRLRQYSDIYRSIGKNQSKLYGISPVAFNNQRELAKERVYLNLDTCKIFNSHNISTTNIFVFDAVIEQKVIPETLFYQFVAWFCCEHFKESSIAIKFHPFQTPQSKKRILDIFFESGIEVQELDNDLLLEVVFSKESGLSVFGIGSSLLNYAEVLGEHDVFPLYKYFLDEAGYRSPRLPLWEGIFKR